MSQCLLLPLILLSASAHNSLFDRATAQYEAGKYETAIQLYEQLISEGVDDASVFYNLGNAYYMAGRRGPAVANFERALQADPGFENARANLAESLEKTRRKLDRPGNPTWQHRLLFWGSGLAPRAALGFAVVFWFLGWLLLGARLLAPVRYLRRLAILAGILAVSFGVTAWIQLHPPLFAVVSKERISARTEPRSDSPAAQTVYEGDRVRVESRRAGWARVSTVAGDVGWIPEGSLTFVGPPYLRPADTKPAGAGPEGAA